MQSSLVDWQSGYGPPPEPPPRDYSNLMTTSTSSDNRLRTRFEACRSGMQELDTLRTKHSLMIQNLRSRLPIIPGCLDDVQTREKKSRDVFLDRFSLQSVDSGVSSQNTINSTRSSSPDDFNNIIDQNPAKTRHSNIYENNTTMNYSTFRKLSLESNSNSNSNNNLNNNNRYIDCNKQMAAFAPPVITSRSCHRGAWKTSPKRVRPKSMFDTSSTSTKYLFEKPPRHPHPIDLSKERRSAFTVIPPAITKRHSTIDQSSFHMSQLSLDDAARTQHKPLRTAQKPEVVRRTKVEKADAMFRANVVYVSSPEQPVRSTAIRFSPARSPPVIRAQLVETHQPFHAMPCKIRSPKLNSKNVFAAKPIAVRPNMSPKIANYRGNSTWLQSQPL